VAPEGTVIWTDPEAVPVVGLNVTYALLAVDEAGYSPMKSPAVAGATPDQLAVSAVPADTGEGVSASVAAWTVKGGEVAIRVYELLANRRSSYVEPGAAVDGTVSCT